MHHIWNILVDGVFGEWTEWSDCTKMCGGGDMYRNRTCIGPWFGGQPCDGQRNQNSTCNEHDCPGNSAKI